MAILHMVVVGEWFDPAAGPPSAQQTAVLHGRLALRIARGGAVSEPAASARAPGRARR